MPFITDAHRILPAGRCPATPACACRHSGPRLLLSQGGHRSATSLALQALSKRSALIGLLTSIVSLTGKEAEAETLAPPPAAVIAQQAAPTAPAAFATKPYTSSKGFSLQVPTNWVVAYDRSDRLDDGVLLLCGNFAEIDTVSVSKLLPAEVGLDSGVEIDEAAAAKVVESLVAEQRDSGKALTFKLYGTKPRTLPSGEQFWDAMYLLEICNGRGQEVSGGKKLCLSATNMELQTVARISYLTFGRLADGSVWVVKGAARADRWGKVQGRLVGTVQSFAAAAGAAGAAAAGGAASPV